MTSKQLILLCWGLVGVVCGLGAVYNYFKVPVFQKRSGYIYYWFIAILLLWFADRHIPNILWRSITHTAPWLWTIGVVCLTVFTLLTLWARLVLGKMWASSAMLKINHQLHTDGPYRITRHPIYTGMLGMLLGTTLISGFGRMLPYLLVSVIVLSLKISTEEKLMPETFGRQYVEYRQRVPQLIPGLKWSGKKL